MCIAIVFIFRESQVNQESQEKMANQDVLLVQGLLNICAWLSYTPNIGIPRKLRQKRKNLGARRSNLTTTHFMHVLKHKIYCIDI